MGFPRHDLFASDLVEQRCYFDARSHYRGAVKQLKITVVHQNGRWVPFIGFVPAAYYL